ncbi:hypothetical protein LCGC14_2342800 [marine sediment metagenome]|uniref:Uncharacterized protein n=1 Tax=marine sediment metagenome TaxID=412755 RepID=A0A0F9F6L4_9ZZZZ
MSDEGFYELQNIVQALQNDIKRLQEGIESLNSRLVETERMVDILDRRTDT